MRDLIQLVVALTLIAAVAGLGLALVYDVTKEPIALAEKQKETEAIEGVVGMGTFVNSTDDESSWLTIDSYRFFVGRDAEDRITGIAFKVSTEEGYGGTIETWVGIDTGGRIIKIDVFNHRETPGLGTKVDKDDFKDQFSGKSLENSALVVAKDFRGGPNPPIDAVTGATISSRAVTDSVRKGLEFYRDHAEKQLEVRAAETGSGEDGDGHN